MATKYPLVTYGGQIEEIRSGDSLNGVGSGSVTTFSAGDLSPLFTTTETNPTTTPALAFAPVNQNPNIVYAGPGSGSAAAPTFRALVSADMPNPLGVNTSSFSDPITGTSRFKAVDGNSVMSFRDHTSSQGWLAMSNGTITGFVGHLNNTDGFVTGSFSNHPVVFRTNNTNRVTIDTAGKLTAPFNAETFGASWDGSNEPALKDDVYGGINPRLPQTLVNHYADAGNSGTSETDLYADTIPAATLDTNGKKLVSNVAGSFVLSATATRQLKVKFGPSGSETTIFDSGVLSVSVNTDWELDILIIRESSTVVRCRVLASTTSASAIPYVIFTRITGLTLSSATVLKVTGQAAGVGAATNDIVAKLGTSEMVN